MSGYHADEDAMQIESLNFRVKALSRELARVRREHRETMAKEEKKGLAADAKRNALSKQNAALKESNHQLQQTCKAHAGAAEAAEAESRALNQEVKRLCHLRVHSKRRIQELESDLERQPDTSWRSRVKSLCRKYHSDKVGEAASCASADVIRDLTALLDDSSSTI